MLDCDEALSNLKFLDDGDESFDCVDALEDTRNETFRRLSAEQWF